MAEAASPAPLRAPQAESVADMRQSARARTRPLALAVAVLVVAAIGTVSIAVAGGGASARSWGQIITFAVIVVMLVRMAPGGVQVPRLALVGAALAAALGATLRLSALDISGRSFIVAQLREDQLQSDAKILRDRMRSAAPLELPVHVGTISRQVTQAEEAQAIINSDPSVWGVAWGTPRWTSVSLRVSPPLSTSSLPQGSYARRSLERRGITGQQIIVSVPIVGLSDVKLPATGQFLGRLAQVWPSFPTALRDGTDADSLELELRALAALKAAWTSNAHRAVPMWMTGTLHLVRAVSGPQVEEAELRCALRAFEAALAQLRPGDNRPLQTAILNNLAVATLFRAGVDLGSKQAQRQARAIFGRVLGKGKLKRSVTAEDMRIVAANLRASRGLPPRRVRS